MSLKYYTLLETIKSLGFYFQNCFFSFSKKEKFLIKFAKRMKPKIGRNSRLSNKIMIAALNLPRQRKPLTKGPGTLAKQKLMPVLLERYFST